VGAAAVPASASANATSQDASSDADDGEERLEEGGNRSGLWRSPSAAAAWQRVRTETWMARSNHRGGLSKSPASAAAAGAPVGGLLPTAPETSSSSPVLALTPPSVGTVAPTSRDCQAASVSKAAPDATWNASWWRLTCESTLDSCDHTTALASKAAA